MARRLLVTDDVCSSRGKLLWLPPYVSNGEDFPFGSSRVRLIRPDGSTLEATIAGTMVLWALDGPPEGEPDMVIALEGLDPADVPVGTEVWLDSPSLKEQSSPRGVERPG